MRLTSAASLGSILRRWAQSLTGHWHIRTGALAVVATMALATPAAADKYASIVVDYQTGRVLHAVDPDQQLYPASLTKMMTLYMAFDALNQRRVNLDMGLPVSDHAAAMAPSKLNLRPGSTIRLEDAILALVTKSANDAAVAIAEGLGGTEANFARMMTSRAHALGMNRTQFANASGLPNPNQVSTARDMATLGRALVRDFPNYYPYFNTRSFTYNNQTIGNHNRLLTSYDGADGIKTGFINASGFNLVASAKRDGRRLVAAVFGGQTGAWRDAHMRKLLDAGFATPAHGRDSETMAAAAPPPPKPAEPTIRRVSTTLPAIAQPDRRPQPQVQPASLKAAPVPPPAPAAKPVANATPSGWTIQIGAFAANDRAQSAAQDVVRTVRPAAGGKVIVASSQSRPGTPAVYRARISGLAEPQAREACRTLSQQNKPCMALAPGSALN